MSPRGSDSKKPLRKGAADTTVQVNQQFLQQGEERRAFIFYATEDELADSGDFES